jgi:hypothetical protein
MCRSLLSDPFIQNQIATAINEGREKISRGCTKIRDRDGDLVKIDRQTFRRYCLHLGITLKAHEGRPLQSIKSEVVQFICEQAERPGAMKMYEYANTIGFDVSRRQVYKVYEQNRLFEYRSDSPPKDKRCRYEACQKDLI